MDKSYGDGADSADDSGSSQSYPSTLPGIPKVKCHFINSSLLGYFISNPFYYQASSCFVGDVTFIFYVHVMQGSARQLFQRLQGPQEEDTLKSHFEKIIMIGQKQHYRKTQVFLRNMLFQHI